MSSAGTRPQTAPRSRTADKNCRRLVTLYVLVFVVVLTACGKKGPPLAPFSDLPAAVASLTAKRVGPQVVIQFSVPAVNIDGRQPADLDRVELYAHTARLLQPTDYLKRGTIVGSVKVRRPAVPSEDGAPPRAPEPGVDQGAVVTIVDTPENSAPPSNPLAQTNEVSSENAPLYPDGGGPLLSPRRSPVATRYYVAFSVNPEGRRGPPSAVTEVPVMDPPTPPSDVEVTYAEKALTISWVPSAPLPQPIQEAKPESDGLPSRPVVSYAASGGYNVYEVAPDAKTPESVSTGPPLAPLNSSPLTTTTFEDSRIEFGTERCFVVRSQETVGSVTVESAASETKCVTPADTFAPAAPRSISAVGSEGAISLIWEPNTETDLAGYLVLRGEAPGEKLQALTTAPITETTYRDTTVKPGVAYVYAVIAVDKANNMSAQSDPITEKGR